MSCTLKSILLSFALLLALPSRAESIWQIQEIQGESDEKITMVTVSLDRQLEQQKIKLEEHGTFIQVLIPKAHVLQPGQFIDGNSPLVRKIAAFQINETTAGLRLFVAEEAAKVMPAVTTDILGSRLLINIEHNKVSSQIQEEEIPFTGVPSAEEVIRRTEVRQDIADPAVRTHENADSLPMASSEGQMGSLQEKLEWVTAGSAIVFLFMTLFVKYRRRWQKKRGDNGGGPAFSMKTLASFPLAPKQRITLVEVAGQKILLGVSPENINFLTEIHDTTSHTKRSQQILNHISQKKTKMIAKDNPAKSPIMTHSKVSLGEAVREKSSTKSYAGAQIQGEAFATNLSGAQKKTDANFQNKVGDQAATKNVSRNFASESTENHSSKNIDPSSIEDVTNLIRRKLKDLPKI
ncbi:MAG: flagellar biosynthetic protein FliO [Oligoflexus sp.]